MGINPYDSLVDLYADLERMRKRVKDTLLIENPNGAFPYQHTLIDLDRMIDWLGQRTD